jgi:O-antigen/teichoic acid export membrane protein
MSLLTTNILANYAGRGWVSAVSLIVIPFYVRFMGIESYGLIGFITTLQLGGSLLHDGIATILNRELARLSGLNNTGHQSKKVLRTLEVICWALAIIIAVVFVLLAPLLASHWLKLQELSTSTVVTSIIAMGLALGLSLPYTMYIAGLMGLQRQALANVIGATTTTVRFVGSIVVLYFISPSVEAYALWQIPAALIQTFTAAFFLHRVMPKSHAKAKFSRAVMMLNWRFGVGFSTGTALLLILLQADKIVLSKLLPLDLFGYYSLAWTLAISAIGLVADPIRDASFPQLARYVQIGERSGLADLYHGCCQIAGSVIIPVTVIISLFSHEILFAWTRDPLIARNTGPILQLLIIGMAFQGLNALPKNLQLTYGWTRLMTGMNTVALMFFVPLVIVLTNLLGPSGAAIAWIIVWGTYLMSAVWFTHRRVLIGEQRKWYIDDFGRPLLGTLVLGSFFRYLVPGQMSTVLTVLYIGIATSACIGFALIFGPQTREWILRQLRKSLSQKEFAVDSCAASVLEKKQL